MQQNIASYPTHPICQHVGCESDGTIIAGNPPRLRCKRCQRQFTEFDDLDGGHSTQVPAEPGPAEPFTGNQKAALNAANLFMQHDGCMIPIEFR